MKFIVCFIVVCCISNVVCSKFECRDSVKNLMKYENNSVFLIHSYGLHSNNTLTKKQKSLFLIQEDPIEKFLVITESNLRRSRPFRFSVPFHDVMKRVDLKSNNVARCGKYLNGTNLILLLNSTGFGNYLFLYGCNIDNGNSITILMMEGYHRNFTVQELTSYFSMTHQIYKYQVANLRNTGFCTCSDTNSILVDCIPQQTNFGVLFFWIFSFICIVNALLMYAFDYVTDCGIKK